MGIVHSLIFIELVGQVNPREQPWFRAVKISSFLHYPLSSSASQTVPPNKPQQLIQKQHLPPVLLAHSVLDKIAQMNPQDSHHMDSLRQEKIQKFEEFVDKRLKPDLLHAITQRDRVFEQQKIFADLRRNIESLEKNSVTSLRTLVNLGSEVYLQAEVPDTQHIFVDIGLGFHVEFTWSEALNYIEKREEKIARQIEEYTQLIASIKAQIKLVCEGIRELLQLPAEKSLPERIF
ncbi:hypothetical protein VNO77_39831 [Canavalia gladiata]|uniref:Ubiquitously expressed prefoldin like chaperone n=1 Tax=Canavalia gladiata TaxID=3824 RepID=A0AAN9PPB0_CANGL